VTEKEQLTVTEVLNALLIALAERNEEKDEDLAQFWSNTLRTHADMLEECNG